MPINLRSPGRVGGSSTSDDHGRGLFCVDGIVLTERLTPVRNAYLEALLVGRLNAFNDAHVQTIRLFDEVSGDTTSRTCYYTSVWNLAARGIEYGKDPRVSSRTLRSLVDETEWRTRGVDELRNELLPAGCPARDARFDGRSRSGGREKRFSVDPAITDEVLDILAEEGILEDDARTALTELIREGAIRASLLKRDGPLYVYGNDRRHIVSRVLNYINSHRETPVALEEDRLVSPL